MIQRESKNRILEMATKFPVIAFTGPRQSGKTTLARLIFPNYKYVTLENPDNKVFATSDPKGFLNTYNDQVIIDEIQNVPELFSYIQGIVDESNKVGQFIISGSQNFLLMESITQSLAGRVFIFNLLPLTQYEIQQKKQLTCFENIYTGGYPRIYDKNIDPSDFYPSYINTYLQKDIRSILNIHNYNLFNKFIHVCAAHAGQILNMNSISNTVGVDIKTIQSWLSILETSFIIFLLKPWHNNFSKRTVKSPKLYFYDTGLLCSLLQVESPESLLTSQFKGPLFENFAILEIMKSHFNQGISRNYYYWRDSNGNEVDLLIPTASKVQCIEMKASQTVKSDFIKTLHYFDKLDHKLNLEYFLVNTSDEIQKRSNETILGWRHISYLTNELA